MRTRLSRRSALASLTTATIVVPFVALGAFGPLGCGKKPSLNRARCDEVIDQAHAAMRTIEVTLNAGQHSCVDHNGCIEVARPSCIQVCSGIVVPAKDADYARQRVRESDERECKLWRDADCASIAPRPAASCVGYVPRCVKGTCQMVAPWTVSSGE